MIESQKTSDSKTPKFRKTNKKRIMLSSIYAVSDTKNQDLPKSKMQVDYSVA